MIVLTEFAIHRRAAVAAVSREICFYLAARDIEKRHVTAGVGRRAVGAAATQENGRVRDDGETMRMTTSEFVQLHELDAFWISLRQQPLCGVGTQYRDGCVEHAAWRMIRGTLQVLAGFRNRDLREDFVIGRSRDEARSEEHTSELQSLRHLV